MPGDVDEAGLCAEIDVGGSVGVDAVELVESSFGSGDSNNLRAKRRPCSFGKRIKAVRQIPLDIRMLLLKVFEVFRHPAI